MHISKIKLEQFTAFQQLEIAPGAGINVLVGTNGTGKTHLMKVAYAACDVSKTGVNFGEKLTRVFMPANMSLGRLVARRKKSTQCSVEVARGDLVLNATFSSHAKSGASAKVIGAKAWSEAPVESVYIPVKEMLSNAPGFRSLYAQREIHFEEIYADILDRAYRPTLRGPVANDRQELLSILQEAMAGKVTIKDEAFFLYNNQGNLEFSLLAEGIRKLGLLWLLIQNGTLLNGSVLFWDEPETNLNPELFGPLMEILLSLQRAGVQVFLATHDFVVLKELDLRKQARDAVTYHALFRKETEGSVQCHSTDDYLQLHPNAIQETFLRLYDREVMRDLEPAANE